MGFESTAPEHVPLRRPFRLGAAQTHPVLTAFGLAAVLIALFLVLQFALGGLAPLLESAAERHPQQLEDIWIAVVLLLLVVVTPFASSALVRGAQRTFDELGPVLSLTPAERERLRAELERFPPRSLRVAGVVGLLVSLTIPIFADQTFEVYRPAWSTVETTLHRVLVPLIGWFFGRFCYVLVVESRRLSQLGRLHIEPDLLQPQAVFPFGRQGLRNALLVIGLGSILSLLLFDTNEPGLVGVVATVLLAQLVLAAVGLWLPVRGVHECVRDARTTALARCGAAIRSARDALEAGQPGGPRLADLVAYRGLLEGARAWPYDAPTLARFALYLLIPLASVFAESVVEWLLGRVLG